METGLHKRITLSISTKINALCRQSSDSSRFRG